MRVLAVVHQRDAGPGVFAQAASEGGHEPIEWVPAEGPAPGLDGLDAAIVFGGAMNVDEEDAYAWLAGEKALVRELLERDLPVLGVCLGAQLLAEAAGAAVAPAPRPEVGWHDVELTAEGERDPLLGALPRRFEAFAWHSYEAPLPPGGVALAQSPVCLQAFRLDGRAAWGVQFHPEVTEGIVEAWLVDYERAEDRMDLGIEPAEIRRATAPRMAAWNEVGRGLARRFLVEAERADATPESRTPR